ncbi:lipase family protein [Aestuariivirga sp.]|uniref:lipase family protein n=1 Tax=Aestuariivirga sp. TaxID=2650926 RepID=UPI0039E64AF3
MERHKTLLPELTVWRILCGLLALALLFHFAAKAEARPSWTGFYTVDPSQAALPPGTLIRYEKLGTPPFFRAKGWRILYATRDYAGRPIISSGLVVLPDYASSNPAARTIVAWAHPTTGVARQCAPSLTKQPLGTMLALNSFVTSGHIVAATDYPGLGTVGPMGYLIGKGQAYAVIDSVRAAKQIPGVGGGNRYALWGYSQGAQAVLFASLLARGYAPELQPVGVAATAPPTDLERLLAKKLDTTAGRIISSFAIGSWAVKYGLPLEAIASPTVISYMRGVDQNCINNFSGMMAAFEAQQPLKGDFLSADPSTTPGWRQAVTDNSLYSLGKNMPALIQQGDIDQIVSPGVTTSFVRTTCRNGVPVKYVTLKQKGHGTSADASVPAAVGWINDRFAGSPAPSSCR